ncbi:MAG: hypothetical protein KKH98_03825 [Spirochaetes bacterium]|nr:hypothetical protein [Spirochaetota bacterium]
MKKYYTIILLIILGYTSALSGTTRTVGASGADHTTIGAALAIATSGDTIIIIDSGEYRESLYFTAVNSITLKGQDPNNKPIIWHDAQSTNLVNLNMSMNHHMHFENLRFELRGTNQVAINIAASNLSVVNCEFETSNLHTQAISNRYADSCSIVHCTIKGFTKGIAIHISRNSFLFYNTIVNCETGIDIVAPPSGGDTHEIYNNTLVNNLKYGLNVTNSFASPMNLEVKNNIGYNNGIYDFSFGTYNSDQLHVQFGHNCYQPGKLNQLNYSDHNEFATLWEDPNFRNPASDYRLSKDSPCIDRGDTIYFTSYGLPFLDDLVEYGQRDIGAHEYKKEKSDLPESSDYIELSANNLTIGKETTITLKDLQLISEDKLYIKADIFSISGRLVKNLFDQNTSTLNNIELKWNGQDTDGEYVGAGVYLLQVRLGSMQKSAKIFFVP